MHTLCSTRYGTGILPRGLLFPDCSVEPDLSASLTKRRCLLRFVMRKLRAVLGIHFAHKVAMKTNSLLARLPLFFAAALPLVLVACAASDEPSESDDDLTATMKTVTVVQTANTTSGTCNPQDFFLSYEFAAKKLLIVACAAGSAETPELTQVSVDRSSPTSAELSQLKTHLAKIARTKWLACSAKSDQGEQVSIDPMKGPSKRFVSKSTSDCGEGNPRKNAADLSALMAWSHRITDATTAAWKQGSR
jgi:hypothetical protein